MKRNHNHNRIKKNYSYSVAEACETLRVHKNTFLSWIKKEGLKATDGKKPFLVHGSDLKEFLQKRQDAQKVKCKDDELFCTKCQRPQRPFGNLIDVFLLTKTRGNLQGLCSICDTKTNKIFGVKKFDLVRKTFDISQVHGSHLLESLNSSSNCDFN